MEPIKINAELSLPYDEPKLITLVHTTEDDPYIYFEIPIQINGKIIESKYGLAISSKDLRALADRIDQHETKYEVQ